MVSASITENPRVRYRVEDFCGIPDRGVDVVFAWFPFVLRYALLRWGLLAALGAIVLGVIIGLALRRR